jgi:ribonucleoside-diphosphate reductase alpha chain
MTYTQEREQSPNVSEKHLYTLTDTQQHYFDDRYAMRDSSGKAIESDIDQAWQRVAGAIADTPEENASFYALLKDFKFVPGGRILSGAGAESEKTFYNCYVIPVEAAHPTDHYPNDYPGNDSREAIFDTIKTMVDIMSRGGGVGINWSVLRPSGSYLTRISGSSSGPVGWMDVASKAVGEVIQGGSRRGAAMFMMDDWHPDVMKFIDAKRDNTKITNANISVSVSDRFMEAVENDEEWNLVFPDTTHPAYNKEWDGDLARWQAEGRPVRTYLTVKAVDLWTSLAEAAWSSGEPGVVFIERYNKLSTANGAERIISVNPCGEQGLGAYSVCNLGAMNLDAYVRTYPQTNEGQAVDFNWFSFRNDVATAINFLDNVIDKNYYFLPQTKNQQRKLRRIGLSVMGLADALVRLGIRYGSEESVKFTEDVFRTMKDAAIEESSRLGYIKGKASAWEDSMWDRPYLREYLDRKGSSRLYHHHGSGESKQGLRNLFLLTQAPTGTTSLLAGVNSGIEPYFNLRTWREDRTGGRYVYAKAVESLGLDEAVAWPDYVVTSQQVPIEEHIAVQSAVQKWVDSSVSKTINAPREQTVEETKKAFTMAYKAGLKGIAYYRDGSRDVQVLYHEKPNDRIAELEKKIEELEAKLAFKTRTEAYPHPNLGNMVFGEIKVDNKCPVCDNGQVVHEEGCEKCHSCGWSAC